MKLTMLKKGAIAVAALFTSVSMTACNSTSNGNVAIDGMQYSVAFVGGNVLLSMTIAALQVDGGAVIPIPKYPHSSLQIGPDFQSNGTLVVLTISAEDFLGGNLAAMDPHALPDGRPLPGVAQGALPAMAFNIPQLAHTTLYIGPKIIGFFVPFKFKIAGDAIVTFRFSDNSQKNVGIIALVGAQSTGLQSGVLAMLNTDLLGILGAAGTKAAN